MQTDRQTERNGQARTGKQNERGKSKTQSDKPKEGNPMREKEDGRRIDGRTWDKQKKGNI